jgi:hypothetical protein
MHVSSSTAPPTGLRDLFAEAVVHRNKGDLAAAHVVELAALVAVRVAIAEARREVRHG